MSRTNGRWGLPPKSPFYAVPEAVLRYLAENTTPLEERILHRILAAWRWKGPGRCAVSINSLASEARVSRRSVSRCLLGLYEKGLIEYFEHGQGKKPEMSIRPLVARVAASKLAAKGHRLTPERLDNGQLVAKGHKYLPRNGTSVDPSTCDLSASRVEHPEVKNQNPQNAREAESVRGTASRAGQINDKRNEWLRVLRQQENGRAASTGEKP